MVLLLFKIFVDSKRPVITRALFYPVDEYSMSVFLDDMAAIMEDYWRRNSNSLIIWKISADRKILKKLLRDIKRHGFIFEENRRGDSIFLLFRSRDYLRLKQYSFVKDDRI
ncbi:MAG: hypothetical protein J7K23_01965 [Thermoproteales archaeon]|nr:hypothetical protein [Thermoproteales archaeon]